jgi:transposase
LSSLHLREINNNWYLYGTKSVRKESGPRTNQKCIGKVDKEKNVFIKNSNCNDWLSANSISNHDLSTYLLSKGFNSIDIINPLDNQNIDKCIHDSVNSALLCMPAKSFGANHLLYDIANHTGLTNVLKTSFPGLYNEILTIAIYQAVTQDPEMYCDNWIKRNHIPVNCKSLTSQRISELYQTLDLSSIHNFYYLWADFICENDYLACDNTSFSSYTKNIEGFAFGYNRDKDSLKQINLCLLFGETSGLPAFSIKYHGSLNDVKTFCNTIERFKQQRPFLYKLVMDKGFYSIKNVDYMLRKGYEIPFIIPVPASVGFFKTFVQDNSDLPKKYKFAFQSGTDFYLYRSFIYNWEEKHDLFLHLYLNVEKYHGKYLTNVINYTEMLNEAFENPVLCKNDPKYKKYFSFRKSRGSKTGYTVKIKDDKPDSESDDGWFMLISNDEPDPIKAFKIYRTKDVVEKAFDILKNYIHSKKPRKHSIKTITSKFFIDFISLIIISRVHKIMDDNNLYSLYTMKELFNELNLWCVDEINDQIRTYPVTHKQKQLFRYFNCKIPFADVID